MKRGLVHGGPMSVPSVAGVCARCLEFHDDPVPPACSEYFQATYVVPYGSPWSFTESVCSGITAHSAVRLMGRFEASNPERLGEFAHLESVYLSRHGSSLISTLRLARVSR